jgi:hypothetical protein
MTAKSRLGCGSWHLGKKLPVNIGAMADSDDQDADVLVIDMGNDAIVCYTLTPEVAQDRSL